MTLFNIIRKISVLPFLLLVFYACTKTNSCDETSGTHSNVIFSFTHKVDGESLKFDTMIYHTSLGDSYLVNDLQYFISRVSLHSINGKWKDIATDDGIHYIDASDNTSCTWWVNDILPSTTYDTVSFIFGLDEDQNTSGRFPNPPERDMFWPDMLGGGYHYMKLDLKWKNDPMKQSQPFMFHLGIGQMYIGNSVNPDSIIGFIQNFFKVSLPCQLNLTAGGYHQILLQMNIERWFDGQNAFNFAAYPNGIMQNQQGMFMACMNGRKTFSVTIAK
jgi:hypothetical protein